MITRIEIQGFKSIGSADVTLKPINVLLGGNGVGKSNFIAVFELIRQVYSQNLQHYVQRKGGVDKLLHFGKKKTKNIQLSLHFEENHTGHENKFNLQLAAGADHLFIESISTSFYANGQWHDRAFEQNKNESEFGLIKENQAFYVNKRLNEFEVYHFHDTGEHSPLKAVCDINDNRKLQADGSNLAAYLYFLKKKHPLSFDRIEKECQAIAPFFERFDLEPDRLNEQQIRLEWREKGNPNTYFNAHNLSDGTLRYIALLTLLLQPCPPETIIIDEPELGLHPVAVNKLAAFIQKAAAKYQMIIATQSINLVDQFEPEDILLTERTHSGTVFRRLNAEELQDWLEDYSLGDLWGKNVFGGQPYKF